MPRAVGQIDIQKNEAILDAAAKMLSERGLGAPIEAIARLAGVSKQTIYNQYGGKVELVRAMVSRRLKAIAATLQPALAGDPQPALAAFGAAVLTTMLREHPRPIMRGILMSGSSDGPNALAAQVYAAGPGATQKLLADFLKRSAEAGALDVDDPGRAAHFFIGMVVGPQFNHMMRPQPALTPDSIAAVTDEAAARFVRAYAPRL